MGWTTADIPDQHGRTAVVTGANGGRPHPRGMPRSRRGPAGAVPFTQPYRANRKDRRRQWETWRLDR